MMSPDMPPKASSIVDRFGASASFLCAVHCAMLPLVVAIPPSLGLGFLSEHAFERGFVVFSVAVAIASLWYGFRRHHRLAAFLFMVPGVLLLLLGVVVEADHTGTFHAVLVAIGGLLVMAAHIANLRLAHNHVHTGNCCMPSATP